MTQPRNASQEAAMLVVSSSRFADHRTPPGHPERVDRARVMETVADQWRDRGGTVVEPELVAREDLARVHADGYLDDIEATNGRTTRLDPDTHTSPESARVARLAAGAAVQAVDYALEHAAPAVAMIRPPGHHAERSRAMGFCLYNNVAVAAAYARHRGVESVAVVDYDVHHGNGTQWMFYDQPSVLFISTHQYPFYPGTGAAGDVGDRDGAGYTVNLPLAAGAGDADYDLVFREVVLPVLESFAPGLILLSAGYDAHTRDPLGGMNVSTAGYSRMTRMLSDFARHHCSRRLVAVTEGGYDLVALEECLTTTLDILASSDDASGPLDPVSGSTDRAQATIDRCRAFQASYWPTL